MLQGVENKVKSRILGHGRGWIFTPRHFLDLGAANSVRQALFRLEKQKIIRRVAQGIYDYPKEHKVLGPIPPSVEDVVKAVSEKNGAKVLPSGAYAANMIGLSEQVPGRAIFLTDGPPKKFKVGNLEVIVKQSTVKNMHAAGSKEALVIQAFKFMQQKHINQKMLNITKKFLNGATRSELEKNLKFAPEWIRTILFQLMEVDL